MKPGMIIELDEQLGIIESVDYQDGLYVVVAKSLETDDWLWGVIE